MKVLKKLFKEEYLSEFVYGGIDGIVTTFAVVAAVAGAGYEPAVMLVLGFANLISDGISMGFSAYLAEKAEVDQYRKQRKKVVVALEKGSKTVVTTIRKHLRRYGFKGAALNKAADTIAASDEAEGFILREEHGMAEEPTDAHISGLMTFIAFIIFGLIPLSAYLADYVFDLGLTSPFTITVGLAAVAFSVIGALKSKVTETPLVSSVLESLLLGAVASGASYFIGDWLETIIN